MPGASVEQQIRSFIVDNFLFGWAEALRDDDSLLGNIVDSTETIELIMFLQERFGITVEDEEMTVPDNFNSIKSLVAFVERKKAGVA